MFILINTPFSPTSSFCIPPCLVCEICTSDTLCLTQDARYRSSYVPMKGKEKIC